MTLGIWTNIEEEGHRYVLIAEFACPYIHSVDRRHLSQLSLHLDDIQYGMQDCNADSLLTGSRIY